MASLPCDVHITIFDTPMSDTPSATRQSHPAHAVFALMEDRDFRYSVIRPALEARKDKLCRLTSGRYQVRGYRNLAKAPLSLLLPVISDDANVSSELAEQILVHWFEHNTELEGMLREKLDALGLKTHAAPFDEDGMATWDVLPSEQAQAQFDGTFVEGQDKNAVMLMSLLLGWFGAADES